MDSSEIKFGEFRLDLARQELSRSGRVVDLAPLAFRLLRFLAVNRDRTLSREEILSNVWGDVVVSESVLGQALKNVRRAVGDDGQNQAVIKTVRGLGYRFVAPAEEVVRTSTAQPSVAVVGRDDLLDMLAQDYLASEGGQGRAVLLRGDAGIGKTHVLDALERSLRNRSGDDSPIVIRSHAIARSGAPPYWLWVRAFRRLARFSELAELRSDLDASVPTLLGAGIRAVSDTLRSDDPDETERFRIFDAVSQTLDEISRKRPVVFLLDDLHAAGAAALDLLEFLVQERAESPFFLVGTYRTSEMAEGEGARVISQIEALAQVRAWDMEPLSPQALIALLDLHEEAPLDPGILGRIAVHSRGNPFFALELLRTVQSVASRAVSRGREADEIDSTLRLGLARMLRERMRGLSADAQSLAEAAAAMNRRFNLEILSRVLGRLDLTGPLAELIESDLIISRTESAGEVISFSHDLVRESCYANLCERGDAAKRVHLMIAESIGAEEIAQPSIVAFHRAAAHPLGEPVTTIRSLASSAEVARVTFDEAQARWAYGEALRIADECADFDESDRCELLLAAGENAVRSTFADEARGHLLGALRLSRSIERFDWFGRAALGLAARDEILAVAEQDVAQILEEALTLCPRQEHALRARLLGSLALKVRYADEGLESARTHIAGARSEASESGNPAAAAQVLEDASFVEWSVRDPEAWIELNHQIVASATEARDFGLTFRGVKGLATGFLEIGDREAALREMKRCAELARTAPAPFLRAVVALHDGSRSMLAGQFEEGEHHALRAMRSGLPSIMPLGAVQLYYHRLESARLIELESAVKNLVEGTPGVAAWRYAWARVMIDDGRFEEARRVLLATGSIGALPRDRNWLSAAVLATETAVALNEQRFAADLYEQLSPFARVNVVLGHGALCFGNVAHFLGELAFILNKPGIAESHWRSAARMHRQLACRPFTLKSQWGLARLAARENASEAIPLIETIRRDAASLGMARLVHQIDEAPESC